MGSAFTPFTSSTVLPQSAIHSAFTPNFPGLSSDPLRQHVFPGALRGGDIFQGTSHLPYPRLGALTSAPLPGFISNPFPVAYRHNLSDLPCYRKSPEKVPERTPISDSEHASDSWEDSVKERDIE
ncbi:hypothetical protein FSP39_016205 [Pinctada imbricata]|uniref:Uncharacterized protein n=1 Tax=Pinctada imbricata TaxID=66713 RepID=A0AA88Y1I5_PINIB|nr:hypothetical protein FSP39_016205 [Pinctada imbricata]